MEYNSVVVYIETENSSGTGFVITEDGYVITCAHVVNEKNEIYVKIITNENDIQVVKAYIVAINCEIDIAIIKLEEGIYHFATIEEDSNILIGDEIVLLGYPFGNEVNDDVINLNLSFSKGYVSSVQKKNEIHQVLLDISAKAGNSGSPIINLKNGNVIGILCGSILNNSYNHTEEINYMRPIKYLYNFFEN